MKYWVLSLILWIGVNASVVAAESSSTAIETATSNSGSHQEKSLILKNVKPRPNPAYDRESSSYMGDPDPLDPLKVKNESIKEDEEPVLNEIRSMANVPQAPESSQSIDQQPLTSEPIPTKAADEAPVDEQNAQLDKKDVSVPKVAVEKKKKAKKSPKKKNKIAKKSKVKKVKILNDDDADLALERRFHRVYKAYNSQPTSEAAWSKVTGQRKSHSYVVQSGDTLWSISGVLFGDQFFWPKLWAVNRQGIENPHQIEPGLHVNFYPSEDEGLPGLEIEGESSESDVLTDADEIESSGQNDKVAIANSTMGSSGRRSREPTPLPDSMPIWANKRYFSDKVSVKIDLGENINVRTETKNNIILSNEKIMTEFNIPLEQIGRGGRCDAGAIYKKIQAEEGQNPQGEYYIMQPLDRIETSAEQSVHPYEIMGAGNVSSDQFNVQNCHALMDTNFVFIRKDRLNAIRNQSISGENVSEIIGGADLGDQKLFVVDQLVYLSLGNLNVSNGQTVQLKSQNNDKFNGKAKILDRFGNYAVGVLTEVNDVIEKGDSVQF